MEVKKERIKARVGECEIEERDTGRERDKEKDRNKETKED